MRREFSDYPKYRENYVKAFDRMLRARERGGQSSGIWKTGEDVMRWWLGENPKQVTFDDIIQNNKEE